jgi:hypothetical protein
MIYQHKTRGGDMNITDVIDTHVQSEQHQDDKGDGWGDALTPAG